MYIVIILLGLALMVDVRFAGLMVVLVGLFQALTTFAGR